MYRRVKTKAFGGLFLRCICVCSIAILPVVSKPAAAQITRGSDWIVAYNLPSRSSSSPAQGEKAIRDSLLQKIGRLEKGHSAGLATYTLSGDSDSMGAAGPLLVAVSQALDRGAAVLFVVDSNVGRITRFGPADLSLNRLSRRGTNPMAVSIAPDDVLMHHKIGIFDFGRNAKWVFTSSWNFTGGASIFQWNIGVFLRNDTLHAAYAAEMEEFRAGRFGSAKNRRHDGTRFRLEGAWGDCWVRFSPFHGSGGGSRDAETDIIRMINNARDDIYFALNKINRPGIQLALVNAVNRGVRVTGVIPESDLVEGRFAVSAPIKAHLSNPANFRGQRNVVFLKARAQSGDDEADSGQRDLVHTKYMIIDPDGRNPVVIHGSANWTAAGLSSPTGNDENTLFLLHRDIAATFLEHFHRMTIPLDE